MKRELVIAGVCTIAGAVLALQLRPAPKAGPGKVQTDTLYMEAQRPRLEHQSLVQKATQRRIRGQVTIADAPSAPAQLAVRRSCDPVAGLNPLGEGVKSEQTDSSSSNFDEKRKQPTALLPDFGGRRAGPRLELYSTLNNARRWQWTGTVRGRVEWQSSGDSVLVTGDRLWVRVLRGAPGCAAKGAAGGAIGGVFGQDLRQMAVTGAVAALACAF